MCKLLIIPHLDKDKENFFKFLVRAVGPLSEKDGDGFGYAALDSKGNLFSEKWVNPRDAFAPKKSKDNKPIIDGYQGVLSIADDYRRTGKVNMEDAVTMIIHARKATSSVSIKNTHPFLLNDTALIHNGMVDTDNLELKESSCDSEGILNVYIKSDVINNINNIKDFAKQVKGSYACGILAKDILGQWYLDIIKDNSTKLSAAFISELNTLVFCTDINIVINICRRLKWHITTKFVVKNNHIIRHDALTGKVLETLEFTPTKRHHYSSTGSGSGSNWSGSYKGGRYFFK